VAQLIEADTGFHLWSNSYDLEMSDIFEVQDNVANSVALAMQVTLGGDTEPGGGKIRTVDTESVAAYEKYLKGLQQKNSGGFRNYLLAEILFKEALALDADFYEARLHLAHTYFKQLEIGVIASAEASEYIRPLLDRLLAERPDNGSALAIAARVQQYIGSFNVDKHLAELTAAVERTPNEPILYRTLGRLLSNANRPEEALQWLDRGLVVDPLDWRLHFYRGGRLMELGRLDAAAASYERIMELSPDNVNGYSQASSVSWRRKQYAESFKLSRKAMEVDPLDHELPVGIAINLYTVGLMEEGDQYLQRAITIAPDKAVVRAAELYRLMLLDDHSRVRDLSETLLRDDVDTRRGAYWLAVMAFMSTMSEEDKTDQALTVLEELRPGVSSPDFDPRSPKDHALQYFAVLALARTQSQVETLRMLDAVVPRWDESFSSWRNYWPGLVAPIAMARGQTDVAVELMLEDLESGLPFSFYFYRPPRYQHIYYYKILALEPPIAERLAELDAEAKRGGEEIRAYIMENDLQL
jgi:tetratricopeptide (TPR) repeat protein